MCVCTANKEKLMRRYIRLLNVVGDQKNFNALNLFLKKKKKKTLDGNVAIDFQLFYNRRKIFCPYLFIMIETNSLSMSFKKKKLNVVVDKVGK